MRRALIAFALVVLSLAGCTSGPGFGVAMTLTFSPMIDDATLESVTALHIVGSGDEMYEATVPLEREAHRTERELYRPKPSTLTLDITVTALDVSGDAVALGTTGLLTLVQTGTTYSALTLEPLGVPDGGVDIASSDGPLPDDGGHVDLGGHDAAVATVISDGGIIAGYKYSRTITVEHGSIGTSGGPATLTDYPVLVTLTDDSIKDVAQGGHVQTQQGYDITATATGATCNGPATCQLAVDLDRYDATNGVLALWVSVPSLNTQVSSSDTTFTLFYGDSAIDSQVYDPTKAWNDDYRGVWHFSNGYADSTGKHPGSAFADTSGSAGGIVSTCATFDAAGDNVVTIPSSTDLDFVAAQDFTISVWVKTSLPSTTASIVSKLDDPANNPKNGYAIQNVPSMQEGPPVWDGQVWNADTEEDIGAIGGLASSEWQYAVFMRQGGTFYVFQNGSQRNSGTDASTDTTNTLPLRFGGSSATTATELFVGSLDEIRISSVALGAAWIATDYALATTPSIVKVGSETSH